MPAMTTPVHLKTWRTEVTAAAVMSRAAAMGHGAPAIHGMAVAIMSHDHLLAIHGGATRAAAVREAGSKAAVIVVIASFGDGGSQHGKAGRDGQKSDDFFHDGGMSLLRFSPPFLRHAHETLPPRDYSRTLKNFGSRHRVPASI